MNGGRFISLEGVDGSGKSTQAAMLADALEARGLRVVRTREPGGTELGEALRTVLLAAAPESIEPVAEMYLFAAARAQLVREVIAPALADGAWVVADRFLDSSLAYQGGGRELGIDVVLRANRRGVAHHMPARTLLIDTPHDEALARCGPTPDRIEGESPAFRLRVEQGYRDLLERFPVRLRAVDGRGTPDEVHRRVVAEVAPLLEVSV